MSAIVDLPEYVGEIPNICGSEEAIRQASKGHEPVYAPYSSVDFGQINSCFASALHKHQPMIPAGGDDLRTARVISNLQAMMDRPDSTPTLTTIDVPTLIVTGDEDAIIPVSESESMHAAIRHSTLEVITGAGHLTNVERPAAFNHVVSEFIAKLSFA